MAGIILQRVSTLTLNLKHFGFSHLSDRIPSSLPSPKPTVKVSQVPALFREPYILSGYRPTQQDWRCYLLSLFQRHNESLNVWTHILACAVLLLRWWANAGALGYTLDLASLPLLLFLLSSLTYLFLSVMAHLFQSHSEHAHYFFFFLDYVGVGIYQYGCSLAHYFYTAAPLWRETYIGFAFLPSSALLAWLSCTACCFAKYRYRRPYPVQRKLFQVIPSSLAYMLDVNPVVHRLFTVSWTQEPSLFLHALQIASFLLSALFFSCHIPECFFVGRCDFIGQGHQIFHVFLALCTMFQLEALFQDYARQGHTVLEVFGESQLRWSCVALPVLFVCSILTTLVAMRFTSKRLQDEQKKGG